MGRLYTMPRVVILKCLGPKRRRKKRSIGNREVARQSKNIFVEFTLNLNRYDVDAMAKFFKGLAATGGLMACG